MACYQIRSRTDLIITLATNAIIGLSVIRSNNIHNYSVINITPVVFSITLGALKGMYDLSKYIRLRMVHVPHYMASAIISGRLIIYSATYTLPFAGIIEVNANSNFHNGNEMKHIKENKNIIWYKVNIYSYNEVIPKLQFTEDDIKRCKYHGWVALVSVAQMLWAITNILDRILHEVPYTSFDILIMTYTIATVISNWMVIFTPTYNSYITADVKNPMECYDSIYTKSLSIGVNVINMLMIVPFFIIEILYIINANWETSIEQIVSMMLAIARFLLQVFFLSINDISKNRYLFYMITVVMVAIDTLYLIVCFAQLRQTGSVLYSTNISFNWPHL